MGDHVTTHSSEDKGLFQNMGPLGTGSCLSSTWDPPGTGPALPSHLGMALPSPGRILVEALALAHGVEACAQLGQAAHPALCFLGCGRRQVQVFAAPLEGDGEAACRREGTAEAPQALGLVALADGLDVLHEDCGEGRDARGGSGRPGGPGHCTRPSGFPAQAHRYAAKAHAGCSAGTTRSGHPPAAGTAAPCATSVSGSCRAGIPAAWHAHPHPLSGLQGAQGHRAWGPGPAGKIPPPSSQLRAAAYLPEPFQTCSGFSSSPWCNRLQYWAGL